MIIELNKEQAEKLGLEAGQKIKVKEKLELDEMITVKVTYDDGDYTITRINTDLKGAKDYYLGKTFNVGIGPKDKPKKVVKVEKFKESIQMDEQVDIKKIIQDLKGDFAGSNEDQLRGLQLLKGLATSDDPLANQYMKKLNTATTQISNELSK